MEALSRYMVRTQMARDHVKLQQVGFGTWLVKLLLSWTKIKNHLHISTWLFICGQWPLRVVLCCLVADWQGVNLIQQGSDHLRLPPIMWKWKHPPWWSTRHIVYIIHHFMLYTTWYQESCISANENIHGHYDHWSTYWLGGFVFEGKS